MIKEALQYFAGLVQASDKPVQVVLPGGNRGEALYAINGRIEEIPISPLEREHHVETLEDLILATLRFAKDRADIQESPPAIFHNKEEVRLIIDDSNFRLNSVNFALNHSDIFRRFIQANGQWLEQKAFIRLLKTELYGALQTVSLIDAIRTIKFDVNSSQTGTIDRQRESMGREITTKVKSATDEPLPEEISFWIPVYSNPGERDPYEVRCALETDPTTARLRYCMLPGELDLLEQAAIASIRDRLEGGVGKAAFIYQGRA